MEGYTKLGGILKTARGKSIPSVNNDPQTREKVKGVKTATVNTKPPAMHKEEKPTKEVLILSY